MQNKYLLQPNDPVIHVHICSNQNEPKFVLHNMYIECLKVMYYTNNTIISL